MEILTIKNLSFSYPRSENKALQKLSFSVEEGDFLTIIGATGSGKSTLLRLMKPAVAPKGEVGGEIRYSGVNLTSYEAGSNGNLDKQFAAEIGYVMQRPDEQIVTDKVWHELAFGLENLGYPQDEIRRRVAEMAGYFGIEAWFDKKVNELSGGQKQLLNLAAVMVMQPKLLLLDEPTAQLDPIAAADFIRTVAALNRDLGMTVIMVEHHLEEVLPVSTKILALNQGEVLVQGETKNAVKKILELAKEIDSKEDGQKKVSETEPASGVLAIVEGLPAASRIYAEFAGTEEVPISVNEGRKYLRDHFPCWIYELPVEEAQNQSAEFSEPSAQKKSMSFLQSVAQNKSEGKHRPAALEFTEVYFRYQRELPDVLKGLNLRVYEGEFFCLLGGNGSGKSTALTLAAGLHRPYAGTIRVFDKKLKDYKNQELYRNCLAMLPQDVQTAFLENTVEEELKDAGIAIDELPFDLSGVLKQHPFDLSGGQQQLLALAKALAAKPRLLLLDEPTKGLDAGTKNHLIRVLKDLQKEGMTLVCVTHDVEFAAKAADRCGLLFTGEVVSNEVPRRFFPGNAFYTTAASRIARGFYQNIATVEDAVKLCRQNKDAEQYL